MWVLALLGLAWAALQRLRGRAMDAATAIPLGTALAVAALLRLAFAPSI